MKKIFNRRLPYWSLDQVRNRKKRKLISDKARPYERKLGSRLYFSQACQELFALDMVGRKENGTYIEIGGGDPFNSNNTLLLEKDYSWKGFSIEYDQALASRHSLFRNNTCFCTDATKFDYESKIDSILRTDRIDYLSCDIDPAQNTLKALKRLPMNQVRFSVITYEHDFYRDGERCMKDSRKHLESHGYVRVCSNVHCMGRDFEDWWIDPRVIPEDVWKPYWCENLEFRAILPGL